MPVISMRRAAYSPESRHCEHAGLFLLKGFPRWNVPQNGERNSDGGDNHNQDIANHHQQAAEILPALYEKAYERWKAHLLELGTECGHWFGDLVGRMYLGLGEASPLEAGISLHHTYGVPMIPGSAVKGVLHHYALRHWDDTKLIELIFGREPDPAKEDGGDAGRVIFNDAWWLPGKAKPLVAEVITVHHPDYYSSGGKDAAADFDDPNPNSQIAIQGSFHFSFFADKALHDVVSDLLRRALTEWGIGAKSSSGYGLFVHGDSAEKSFNQTKAQYELAHCEPEQQTKLLVAQFNWADVADKFGPDRNKTAQAVGEPHWDEYINGLRERFKDRMDELASSVKKNEKRAYKALSGEWNPDWKTLK